MLALEKAGGPLTFDARVAALAADCGPIIYSNDADYARYPGLECGNPV